MLLPGALLALFMTGFWLYCLADAVMTPPGQCRGMSKRAWIAVICVSFIGGAIAWLIVRPAARGWDDPPDGRGTDADDAVTRHPAGRSAGLGPGPKGPDDDPEFLRALDRLIRGNS